MASSTNVRDVFLFALPDIDRSASINDFFISLEALMSSVGLQLHKDGMLAFYLHLTDEQLLLRHPGSVRLPIPIEPVMPDDDDELFDRKMKKFTFARADFVLFKDLTIFLISSVLARLPKDDVKNITALDPLLGLGSASLSVIYTYLFNKYGALSESSQENLKFAVQKDLSLAMSLDANFSDMKTANATLTANEIGYTDHQMFGFAFNKMKKNPRTAAIAEDYKKRDGYVPNAASFAAFSAWAVTQYDHRSPPDGTAAFAFHSDPDFPSAPPLPVPVTPAKPDSSVAAATISPGKTITLTEDEYKALVAGAFAPSKRRGPRGGKSSPQSGVPRPALGWCCLCGYGDHGPNYTTKAGKTSFCFKMSDEKGNPLPGYTKAQVTCTTPIGPPVDGLARSQVVKVGFSKP
jgi:hypothetical protein